MKKALCLVLCIVIVVACSGCSQKINTQKTEVVIWHTWNVEEGESENMLKVIVERFNKSQNDIQLVLQSQPSDNYSDKTFHAVANGTGPDIVFEFATAAAAYAQEGYLADISSYIDTEAYKERLGEKIYSETTDFVDNKMHVIPIMSSTPILYYNVSLFNELGLTPPTSWSEVQKCAKLIYEKKGITGFAPDSLIDMAQIMLYQNDAGYIDTENTCTNFNNPKAAALFDEFLSNVDSKYYGVNPQTEYWYTDFNAGLVGMILTTCTSEPYIQANGFEYSSVALPQGGSVNWSPAWNRSALIFKSDEKTEAAACEFMEFFTSPENMADWVISIGSLSPYNDTLEQEVYSEYIQNNHNVLVAAETLKWGSPTPCLPGAIAVRNSVKKAFQEIVGHTKTSKKALADAASTADMELKN